MSQRHEQASPFPDGELDEAAEIGTFDSQQVRLWLRLPGAAEARATLTVADRPAVTASTRLSAETDWTGVIRLALAEPMPDQPFAVQVRARRLTGRLAPQPGAPTAFSFAFGSCHHPFDERRGGRAVLNRAGGIYPAIAEAVGDAAFLLLVGDQFYADDIKQVSTRRWLPDGDQPPPLPVAIDAYRHVCRGYFGQAGFRALRERLPTLCIWDDHDIFQNWGSLLHQTPRKQRLFEAASRVYCEYQHQRNPGGGFGPPPYHYTFAYGDTGFLVLDMRGARDYRQGQMLGAAQWQAVRAYLASDAAASMQTLFVVGGVPIAHTARWAAEVFARLPLHVASSTRDRWTAPAFVEARDALLTALCAWQTAAPHRQVILLAGDIHMAAAFTIRQRHGRGVVQQFVSSALTTPLPWTQALLNWLIGKGSNLFEPRWRFARHFLIRDNNVGLVQVEPLAAGGHRVTFTVHGWQPRQQRLRVVASRTCLPATQPDDG